MTGVDQSGPGAGHHLPAGRRLRARLAFVAGLTGLVVLIYLLGAATMFFQLPPSAGISKGFMGTRAWLESKAAGRALDPDAAPAGENGLDLPGQTYDGYTLFSCASPAGGSNRVSLIDMHRREVYHWTASFSRIWPNPPHLGGRQVKDSEVCVFACHLYPNGDLLVVFHSLERTVRGYGLAKLDKNSNLLWSYSANAHHDVTVGEDGTIYTLVQRPLTAPIRGLEFVPPPWLVDHVAMLSPEGKEVRPPISILEALRNSPYATLLSPLETALHPATPLPAFTDEAQLLQRMKQDVLHTNSVDVLSRATAAAFPAFRPGQVLVSIRELHALAVLDPATAGVVWGACGPWHYQHDARFLPTGRLMLFDNIGSPRGSRVIEYELQDGAFPWSYPGVDNAPFFSKERGQAQRLPNGNTLIVISDSNEMIEVTPAKTVVWSCTGRAFITTARRYGADQLSFLPAGHRPRE